MAQTSIQAEIKGFIETSFLDWPGQVAAVLFLAGCNFRCPFCHNHGLVTDHQQYPTWKWSEIKKRLSKLRGWIDGIVLSGGEPTLSPGLPDLAREIKDSGFMVKLDTNGSRPEVLREMMGAGVLDAVAMDIKASLDEVSYLRAAGRPGFLPAVLESLAILRESRLPYFLRTTVVPGLHSERDILRLARQLHGTSSWKLQNFNPENTLDSSYRCFKPWDTDTFQNLSDRALKIFAGAA